MNSLPPEQMPLFTEDEADSVLKPYYDAIRGFFFGAWQDWEKLPDEMRAALSTRARANFIYDFILFRAKTFFSRNKEVTLIEKRGLFLFGLRGKVLFRFKKLKKDKRHCNIQTQQQIELSLQRELPGMPPKAASLIIGYQLNIPETDIEAILVTYPTGRQLSWSYPITDTGETNVVAIPQAGNQQPPTKPVVKARNITTNKKGTNTQKR
jgi:hypothetical protein